MEKRYSDMKVRLYTQKKDDCWRIALCNYLHISPKKIPHFVKKYDTDFVEKTRKWLNKRGKTLVYIQADKFLEATKVCYNPPMFPQGKCIAVLKRHKNDEATHACLMVNGRLYEKPGSDYRKVYGYFIIYDI